MPVILPLITLILTDYTERIEFNLTDNALTFKVRAADVLTS